VARLWGQVRCVRERGESANDPTEEVRARQKSGRLRPHLQAALRRQGEVRGGELWPRFPRRFWRVRGAGAVGVVPTLREKNGYDCESVAPRRLRLQGQSGLGGGASLTEMPAPEAHPRQSKKLPTALSPTRRPAVLPGRADPLHAKLRGSPTQSQLTRTGADVFRMEAMVEEKRRRGKCGVRSIEPVCTLPLVLLSLVTRTHSNSLSLRVIHLSRHTLPKHTRKMASILSRSGIGAKTTRSVSTLGTEGKV
jgi:hypothetical protein